MMPRCSCVRLINILTVKTSATTVIVMRGTLRICDTLYIKYDIEENVAFRKFTTVYFIRVYLQLYYCVNTRKRLRFVTNFCFFFFTNNILSRIINSGLAVNSTARIVPEVLVRIRKFRVAVSFLVFSRTRRL